jgi:hypothetical protein
MDNWISVCAKCGKEWKQTLAQWWDSDSPLCQECKVIQAG